MKAVAALISTLVLVCLCGAAASAQSGRRAPKNPKASYPVPLPEEPAPKVKIEKVAPEQEQKVYQCLYDGRPLLDVANTAAASEEIFSGRDVTTKPRILQKPPPSFPSEARRSGTGGKVILRVLLSSTAKVTHITVLKELPNGLTESAIKAACRIRFEPAMKDGHPVAMYVQVEYEFWTSYRPIPRFPPFP
jgi:TonB family protein